MDRSEPEGAPAAHTPPAAPGAEGALHAVTVYPASVLRVLSGANAGDALPLPGASVAGVARQSGLSLRSLQRRFQDRHLPPPEFWRLLARARRAVALLPTPAPLAEIAAECGFSDQAHMSRAMARWFGHSPAQLRRDAGLRLLLAQPALGNWTAEQISTR